MKKIVCTMILSVAVVCVMAGLLVYNGTSTVNAEEKEAHNVTSITIRNNTPFELKDVSTDFGMSEVVKTDSVKPCSEAKVKIPEEEKNLTMVKISGTTDSGERFNRAFGGWMKDHTVITIQYDEERNLSVFSNISADE